MSQLNFKQLNNDIPRGSSGDIHEHKLLIGAGDNWNVRVSYPGKHGPNDYVVEVNHELWGDWFPFQHKHMFKAFSDKATPTPDAFHEYLGLLLPVLQGAQNAASFDDEDDSNLPFDAMTTASLALAVCEHRRYPQGDPRGGGRYLPINYTLAILGGYWTIDDASKLMRIGFPALRSLDGFEPFKHNDEVEEYLAAFDVVGQDPRLN